ncbi:MAG: tetratricopeptide repeat protein [Gammaproteobacteria bacterium]|nr:tetratricopeptide repeat protein [Gammaproteobacteria bacterium]
MSTPSGYILEGTEYNFDRLVIENSRRGLVLVDFWAPWAGPSLRQQKVLRHLAEQYGGRFLLVTVNTDEQKGIAGRFGVKSLPSFKLFRNGKVVEDVHGMQPEADYRRIVDKYLVPLGDKVRLAAAKAWNAGEHDKAIQLLAEGAMAEPDNLDLPAMLAKFLMRVHRYDEARDVLAALPVEARDTTELATLRAHLDFITAARAVDDGQALALRLQRQPADLDAHFKAAALHLVNDEYEQALQALIVILRADPGYDNGAARRGLLAIFATLGGDHALVKQYRGELARLIH